MDQAADAAEVLLSLEEDFVSADEEDSFAGVDDALPLLRKSVTYQPVPFNWNPAAVSCFLNALFPQDGQSVSGASDIFCNTSLLKPQSSQR